MTTTLPSHRDLAEVAFLYYVRNMTQQAIADRLRLSRPVVSRMLAMAREEAVVTFSVDFPVQRRPDLEAELLQAWEGTKLKDVVVVDEPVESGHRVDQPHPRPSLLSVAQAGANWLERQIVPGAQIGLSWGSTAQAVVDLARFERRIDATVVQLAGEVSFPGVQPAYELVRKLSEKLGASYHYLSVPASAPSKEVAEMLISSTNLSESLARAGESDIALLGVGALGSGSTDAFLRIARATADEMREARRVGVVGQLSSLLFTHDGREADISLNDRLFSVSLDHIRRIPQVALVAEGVEKARAVEGALNGSLGSSLVVDVHLAKKILEARS